MFNGITITRVPSTTGGFHTHQHQDFPVPGEFLGCAPERTTLLFAPDGYRLLLVFHPHRAEFDVISAPNIA